MKKLYRILVLVLVVFILGGCGSPKLSKDFSKKKLKSAVVTIIDELNNEKFEDIIKSGDNQIQKVDADKIKDAWTQLGTLGNYDSISKIIYQEKDNIAVVIAIVKYEKNSIQLTLSFNKDMKLAGIYMK